MNKFDLFFFIIFIQIGFVVVGLTEIQAGKQLITPQINSAFVNSITGLGNSFNTIQTSIEHISIDSLLAPFIFRLCFPFPSFSISIVNLLPVITTTYTTTCSPGLEIPGLNILTALTGVLGVFYNVILLILSMMVTSTVLSGVFYTAILNSILPASTTTATFSFIIGTILGILQTIIIITDIIKSNKGIGAGLGTTYLNFDLEDQKQYGKIRKRK